MRCPECQGTVPRRSAACPLCGWNRAQAAPLYGWTRQLIVFGTVIAVAAIAGGIVTALAGLVLAAPVLVWAGLGFAAVGALSLLVQRVRWHYLTHPPQDR